jgi:hypothetical protein
MVFRLEKSEKCHIAANMSVATTSKPEKAVLQIHVTPRGFI